MSCDATASSTEVSPKEVGARQKSPEGDKKKKKAFSSLFLFVCFAAIPARLQMQRERISYASDWYKQATTPMSPLSPHYDKWGELKIVRRDVTLLSVTGNATRIFNAITLGQSRRARSKLAPNQKNNSNEINEWINRQIYLNNNKKQMRLFHGNPKSDFASHFAERQTD